VYTEIFRIIDEYSLEPTYDDAAAVNWVYWDETQWVSYDDGVSMQAKIDRANALVGLSRPYAHVSAC
jgi:chitinase